MTCRVLLLACASYVRYIFYMVLLQIRILYIYKYCECDILLVRNGLVHVPILPMENRDGVTDSDIYRPWCPYPGCRYGQQYTFIVQDNEYPECQFVVLFPSFRGVLDSLDTCWQKNKCRTILSGYPSRVRQRGILEDSDLDFQV